MDDLVITPTICQKCGRQLEASGVCINCTTIYDLTVYNTKALIALTDAIKELGQIIKDNDRL